MHTTRSFLVRHTNEIHHLPFLEDLFLKMKIKLKYHRFVTLHEIQHASQLNKCEAKKKKGAGAQEDNLEADFKQL